MTAAAHIHTLRHEPSRLWDRAGALIAGLIAFIGSSAQLIRTGDTTRRERREIGFMIAPVEALVRSLLISGAIAWLIGTDAGADTLREARRNAGRPPPQPVAKPVRAGAASAARTAPPDGPPAEETEEQAAGGAAHAASPLSDAAIAKYLAPASLRFQPCEVMRSGVVVPDARPAAPPAPKRIIRRAPPNLKLARRIEALRHIIADPRAAMLALARDLATRHLGMLYVPSPRNWIDERWPYGRSDIYRARRASFTRFCFFEAHRKRIDTLALPPPEPG